MPKIDDLLRAMVARQASDLHLSTSFKPYIREHGEMATLDDRPELSSDEIRALATEIMPAKCKPEFENEWDTDFAYELPGVGRFRVNVFRDLKGVGSVLRVIPSKVPTADELGLPKAVRDFCYLPKGLVVVTGPTGSGKSTTLAAMIDLINSTRSDHIITVEDPIEFVHTPKRCLINQREVHAHTKSFARALRAALREDPDIVLVGEMRDLETIEIAIETAETGHLVFGTLHTNTAATTVNRIIDKFPADRQNQIRTMLADGLKGVVAQTLCKRKTKGRAAAMEVLVVTNAVSSNIRDGKTHMIQSAMQIGKNVGMVLFNESLLKLVADGHVAPEEAYRKAIDKDDLMKRLASVGIVVDLAKLHEPVEPENQDAMYERVIQESLDILKHDPDNLDALNNIAWIMSTHQSPKLRNAAEALRAAERAYLLTRGQHPAIMDTLGAAYAESGKFDKALDAAKKGLKLALAANDHQLAEALQQRILLYQTGRPLRE